MTHLSLYAKNQIIFHFSYYLSVESEHLLNVNIFLAIKEQMWYFENWMNLRAWELTLKICNFITFQFWMCACLIVGNLQLSLLYLLWFICVKYSNRRSFWHYWICKNVVSTVTLILYRNILCNKWMLNKFWFLWLKIQNNLELKIHVVGLSLYLSVKPLPMVMGF